MHLVGHEQQRDLVDALERGETGALVGRHRRVALELDRGQRPRRRRLRASGVKGMMLGRSPGDGRVEPIGVDQRGIAVDAIQHVVAVERIERQVVVVLDDVGLDAIDVAEVGRIERIHEWIRRGAEIQHRDAEANRDCRRHRSSSCRGRGRYSRLPQSPGTVRRDAQRLCRVGRHRVERGAGRAGSRDARDEQAYAAILEEAARGEGRERSGDRHDVAVPPLELAPVGDEARCGGSAFRRTDDAGSTRADAFDRAWSTGDLLDVYPWTEILRHGAILVR